MHFQVKEHINGKRMVQYMMVIGRRGKEMVLVHTVDLMQRRRELL